MDGSAAGLRRDRPVSRVIEVMGAPAELFGYADDAYFQDAQVHAQHNPVLTSAALGIPRGGVVVDVGANIGLLMLGVARAAWPARYIAAEPSPMARAALSMNAATNGVAGFELIPCALGRETGEVRFNERDFLAGSHRCDGGALTVPVRTLDDVADDLALDRLDLLKIDVEGMEADVLEGAADTLRRFRPTVVVEFCSYTLSAHGGRSPMAVAETLMRLGGGGFYAVRGGETVRVQSRDDARLFLLQNMMAVTEDVWFDAA